jgi:hypothetical protein
MGLEVPDGSTIVRTRAGHWQRAAGSWSWFLVSPDDKMLGLGSGRPATEVIRCQQWEIGTTPPDRDIYTCNDTHTLNDPTRCDGCKKASP